MITINCVLQTGIIITLIVIIEPTEWRGDFTTVQVSQGLGAVRQELQCTQSRRRARVGRTEWDQKKKKPTQGISKRPEDAYGLTVGSEPRSHVA